MRKVPRWCKYVGVSLLTIFFWLGLVIVLVTQPLLSGHGASSTLPVSTQRLQAHVRYLTQTLPPRAFASNLDKAANYLREQLSAYGVVQEQTFEVQGETYRNLSILLGPTTPKRLVIGAHYDVDVVAIGADDKMPGADDNASGVAGLLELARLLSTQTLKQQVELIAYSLEEMPAFRTNNMGSAIHARQLVKDKQGVDLMLSLEMIGYYSDAPNSQDYPLPLMQYLYSDKGDFIAIVGNLTSMGIVRDTKAAMRSVMALPVYSINAPSLVPGIDFSDHRSFWAQGFPALMITDTAFYRNHAYHTKHDTWDRLNYPKMAEVVKGLYAIVMARAN